MTKAGRSWTQALRRRWEKRRQAQQRRSLSRERNHALELLEPRLPIGSMLPVLPWNLGHLLDSHGLGSLKDGRLRASGAGFETKNGYHLPGLRAGGLADAPLLNSPFSSLSNSQELIPARGVSNGTSDWSVQTVEDALATSWEEGEDGGPLRTGVGALLAGGGLSDNSSSTSESGGDAMTAAPAFDGSGVTGDAATSHLGSGDSNGSMSMIGNGGLNVRQSIDDSATSPLSQGSRAAASSQTTPLASILEDDAQAGTATNVDTSGILSSSQTSAPGGISNSATGAQQTPLIIDPHGLSAGVSYDDAGLLETDDDSYGGGVPEIEVYDYTQDPNPWVPIYDETSVVNFGSTAVGLPVFHKFFIKNTGEDDLTLNFSSLSVPAGFSGSISSLSVLAPGEVSELSVKLNATIQGNFGGWVTFYNGDSDESPFNFYVQGQVQGIPEIEVGANVGDIVVDGVTHLDLGTTTVGSPQILQFYISNVGTGDLAVSSSSLTVPTGFSGYMQDIPVLHPGQSNHVFTVTLDATTAGTYSGWVSFNNSDSDESPFSFWVQGSVSGGPPEIAVLRASRTEVPDGTGSVGFGSTTVGMPIDITLIVENAGIGPLTLSPPSLPAGFELVGSFPTLIGSNWFSTFTVRLSASSVGSYSGMLSFGNNDTDENPYNFTLSGQVDDDGYGGAPEIRVLQASTEIPDNSGGVSFGSTTTGTPIDRVFTIENTGSVLLTLQQPSLPSGFILVGSFPSTLSAGATSTFTVRLSASSVGSYSGMLSFGNNDTDEDPYNFTLSGQVNAPSGAPEIRVLQASTEIPDNSGSVSFGSTTTGTPIDRVFTIENTGSALLTLQQPSLPSGFILVGSFPSTLSAGATSTFTVRLSASSVGSYSGMLSFVNNDTDEDPYNFTLSGQVNAPSGAPEIRVLQASTEIPDNSGSVSFGSTTTGTPIDIPFTIENTGSAALSLSSLSLPWGFELVGAFPATVAAGASALFTVRLSAEYATEFSGTLSFTNGDSDESPYDFTITGQVDDDGYGGGAPEIRLLRSSPELEVPDGTGNVDFGSTFVGTPKNVTFTAYNVGSRPLTLSTPSLPAGFQLVSSFPTTIAPGCLGQFTVRLSAISPGNYSGPLSFSNNDTDESPYNFTLQGTVVAPVPEIRVLRSSTEIPDGTGSVSFGSTFVGTPQDITFTVENSGSAALTLGALSVPPGFALVGAFPSTIAAGATGSFTVRLSAATAGIYGGQISFDNNDTNENPYNFAIAGEVISLPSIWGNPSVNEGSVYTLYLGPTAAGSLITQWQVNWGDGNTGIYAGNPGSVQHVYADGAANRTISATAYHGTTTTDTQSVAVGNVAPTLTVPVNQVVYLGSPLVQTNVGSFSDPGFGAGETFSYQINWGDGTAVDSGTPTIDVPGHAGSGGTPPAVVTQGSFDGSHTFTQAGHYMVSVMVTDDDGGTATRTFRADVIDPQYASVSEGTPFTLTLDPAGLSPTTWEILWDDGTPTQYLSGSETSVQHIFADGSTTQTVRVWATNATGRYYAQEVFVSVLNVAPSVAEVADQAWVTEDLFHLVGLVNFTDPGFNNPADSPQTHESFTYTINWGDGTATQNGAATVTTPGAPGVLTSGVVNATHSYATAGTYTVALTVADDDGGSHTESFEVQVYPVNPPALTVVSPQTVNEGADLVLIDLGTFTVPGSDSLPLIPPSLQSFTYSINWGDGSPLSTGAAAIDSSGTPGQVVAGSFDGSHVYADNGNYAVTVTVVDGAGRSDTETFQVTVNNVLPSLTGPVNQTISEGAALDLINLGVIADLGFVDTFAYTINWGDGTAVQSGAVTIDVPGGPGVPRSGSFDGSHVYADNGTYNVVLTVTDDDGGSDTRTFQITVNNVLPSLAGPVNQTVLEGATLSLVNLGIVTDLGFVDTFAYTIDWGDGTAEQSGAVTIDIPGGPGVPRSGSFDGSHVYADNGTYNVVLTVTDDDGGSDTRIFQITVNNVAPTLIVPANQTIIEGTALTLPGIGAFTDPGFHNPANPLGPSRETFAYTINWGDGNPTDEGMATIVTSGSPGALTAGVFDAHHDFRTPGVYPVTVTLRDDDGGVNQKTFTVTVVPRFNASPVFNFNPLVEAYLSKPFTDQAKARDDDGDLPLVYRGTITPVDSSVVLPPDDNFAVSADGHITWTPSTSLVGHTFNVALTVEDQRGATATKTYQITVHPKPNTPPQIKTDAPQTFDTAQPTAGMPDPRVTPDSLEWKLNLGNTQTQTIRVVIPEELRQFFADVVVLVDTSGSMAGEIDWIGKVVNEVPQGMVEDLNDALEADGITDNRFSILSFVNQPNFHALHTKPYTVTVFGPNGDIVSKQSYSDAFGGITVAQQLSRLFLGDFTLPADGEYTVVVDEDGYGGTIEPTISEYQFQLTPIVDGTDQLDLALNTKIKGFVSGMGDQDKYTFQVAEAGYYYFDSLTARSDLSWFLERADGTRVQGGAFKPSQSTLGDALVRLEPGDHVLTIGADPLSKGEYQFQFLELSSGAAPLAVGEKTSGVLRPSAEADAYYFTAQAGQHLSFIAEPAGTFDQSLVRWLMVDRWGNTVFDDSLTKSQHDLIMQAGGEYFLLIEGSVSDLQVRVPYEITVRDEGQESAPEIAGLEGLTLDSPTSGNLAVGGSTSYGFHLDADQLVHFDALAGTQDATWTLQGPGGTLVNAVRLSQAKYSAIQMLPAGDYRLTITSLAAVATDYEFVLSALPLGEVLSATPRSGSVMPRGSAIYQFSGQAGDRLHLDIDYGFSNYAEWRVISPWGQVLKSGSMFDYGYPESDGSEFVIELPASGTFSLVIERDDDEGQAETFSLALHPIVDGSGLLVLNTPINASIASPTEVDTYSFTLATPTLVHLDSRTNSQELVWSLIDGAGPLVWNEVEINGQTMLVPGRSFAQTDAGTLPSGKSSVFALPAGDYAVEVRGLGGTTREYQFALMDLSTSELLPLGEEVTASLTAGNQTQAFRFQTVNEGTGFKVGDQLQFQLTGWNGSTNARWRLVDQFGHKLFDAAVSTASVQVTVPFAGDYYLLIEGAVNDTLARSCSVRVDRTGNQAFVSQAAAIQVNEVQSGEILTSSQTDAYRLTLTGRTQLYLDQLRSPEELPWRIVGPGGTVVAQGHFRGYEYNPYPDGRPVQTSASIVLPAGTYEVQVGGFGYPSPIGEYAFQVAVASAELALGQSHVGEFVSASHAEVFRFQGTAGQRFVLSVDPWGTADQATVRADRLEAPPSADFQEDGYKAITAALENLTFRDGAAKLFILVTDDQRYDPYPPDEEINYRRILSELNVLGGTLHTVLDWPMRVNDPGNSLHNDATDVNWVYDGWYDWFFPGWNMPPNPPVDAYPHGQRLLGVNSTGVGYAAVAEGMYTTVLAGNEKTAMDLIDRAFAQQTLDGIWDPSWAEWDSYERLYGRLLECMSIYDGHYASIGNGYGELAFQTDGGVWDLNELRQPANPQTGIDPAASFSNAFLDFIKRDIQQKLALEMTASSPDALFEVLSARYANGVMEYQVQFLGDGHTQSYDLQFIGDGGAEFGRLPVVILADYSYDLDAVDEDGDELWYEFLVAPSGATIDEETGLITWDPQAQGIVSGEYWFEVRVSDGRGGEATQRWSVTVADVNAGNHAVTLDVIEPVVKASGHLLEIQVYADDLDHDNLSYHLVDHRAEGHPVPAGMTIEPLTGLITWTPQESDIRDAAYQVEIRVSDGRGGAASTWLSVTIVEPEDDRNLRPEITSRASQSVPALGAFAYQLKAIDPNGDPLVYQVLTKPDAMIWDADGHGLYWQPRDADVGEHYVVIEVSDGWGGVTLDSFPLTVTPTNDAPTILSDPADAGPAIANREWRYEVIADDPNHDQRTYSIDAVAKKLGAAIDPASGVLTWSFVDGDIGRTYYVDIFVTDGRGGWDSQRVGIPVNPPLPENEPPVFLTAPLKSATPGEEYRYVIQVGDQIDDNVTFALDAQSRQRGMRLEPRDPALASTQPGVTEMVLTWTPKTEGTFDVTITAWDKHGAQALQSFPLKVGQPHPPKFTTLPTTNAHYDVEWFYAVGVEDEDGDAVTLTLAEGSPAGMAFDGQIPYLLRWTPSPGQTSPVTVTIVATDTTGRQTPQMFDLAVDDRGTQNLGPQVVSRPFGPAIVGQEWTYVVEAVDPENDDLSFELADGPAKNQGMRVEDYVDPVTGAVDYTKRLVRWTPSVEGNYWVNLGVHDSGSLQGGVSHGFELPVTRPNSPPQNIGIPYVDDVNGQNTIYAGQTWRYRIKAVDPDNDFVMQSISLKKGGVESGDYRIESGNIFSWAPAAADVGLWTLSLTLNDGNGGEWTEEVGINVALPATIPIAVGSVTYQAPRVVAFPTDPPIEGQRWSYQMKAISGIANPQFTFSADVTHEDFDHPPGLVVESDGRVWWQVPPGAGGTEFTLRVMVSDGQLASDGTLVVTRFSLAIRVLQENQWPRIAQDQPRPEPAYVGQGWTYEIHASDADSGDTLWYKLDQASFDAGMRFIGSTSNGVSAPQGTSVWLTWTPEAGDAALFGRSVVVTVSDKALGTGPARSNRIDGYAYHAFTVLAGPTVPQPTDIQFSSTPRTTTMIGSDYTYQIELDNAGGHALTYHLEQSPPGMAFDTAHPGLLTWTPQTPSNHEVAILVKEGEAVVARQQFLISAIRAYRLNEPPRIQTESLPGPALRDVEYVTQIQAFDPNRDWLTYRLDTASFERGMAIDPDSGVLRWTPRTSGSFQVEVTVEDDEFSATETFWLNVLRNAPPVIDSKPVVEALIGGPGYSYTITARDPNAGDQLTYEVTQKPAWMSFDPVTHTLSGQPMFTDRGRSTVIVLVRDQDGATTKQAFEVQAYDPAHNDPPVITSEFRDSLPIDRQHVQQIVATDPDGDRVSYELASGAPAGMTVNPSTGVLTWTPRLADLGEKQVLIRAVDSRGLASPWEPWDFTVTATLRNSSPVFLESPKPRRGAVLHHPYLYQPAVTDADRDGVVFSLVAPPNGMTVDAISGKVQWTPTNTSDLGEHLITLRAADPHGGTATYSWTLTVGAVNQPPEITSHSPTLVANNVDYEYLVTAEDPEDGPLTFAMTAGPAGMGFIPGTNRLVWNRTPGETLPLGRQLVTVQVTDELGKTAAQSWTLVVFDPAVNRPPEFAEQPRAWAIVGESYSYRPSAADPDPSASPPFYGIQGRPSGAVWDSAIPEFVWTPGSNDMGYHTITFTASDGMLTQNQTVRLWVRENSSPCIDPIPAGDRTAGQWYAYTVVASDPDKDPLTFSLENNPLGMAINSQTGEITWQTSAADVGSYSVTAKADDGYGRTFERVFSITILPDTTAPTLTLTALPNPAQVDKQFTLSVTASDDVGLAQTTLRLVGFTPAGTSVEETRDELFTLNSFGKASYTPTAAGAYRFQASARDVNENESQTYLSVNAVINLAGPKVSFAVPPNGAEITAPTQIIGTIEDDLDPVNQWRLTAAWAEDPGREILIAEGSGERFGTALGLFDTSLLPNGDYTLTLSACDSHNTWSSATRKVEVRGQLKLGNFSFSVTDLAINTPGVPITISRTYDTLTASKQLDFGYGWKWDLGNPRIDILYSDTRPTLFSGEYIPFRDGTRVVITLPDGTTQGFTFLPQPIIDNGLGFGLGEQRYEAYFHPDPDATTFLELARKITLAKEGDVYLVMTASGAISDFAFNPAVSFTQNDFVLYTKTGVQYGIDPSGSGRTWIEDQKGNRVEYRPQGMQTLITHSNTRVAGGQTRTVTVNRNEAGLISQIVDPAGNSIYYTYLGGELVSVTNRSGKTTDYVYAGEADLWYDPDRHAHYLTTVIDPLGRRTAAAEYRSDGRLNRTKDAADNGSQYSYASDYRSATVAGAGVTATSVTADARGNVICEEGPEGIVLRKYDSWDRLIEETRVVGEIDSVLNGETDDLTQFYAYTAYGQPATQTDVRGNTSTVQYDESGNPTTITNPLGVATANTYDDHGNVLTSSTAGVKTTLEYDAWGNVTKVFNSQGRLLVHNAYNAAGLLATSTDASGQVTSCAYDGLGNLEESSYTVQGVTFITRNAYDLEGRVTDSYRIVQHGADPEKILSSEHTVYNDAGQVYRTIGRSYASDGTTVQVELISENRYDARGLAVEVRTQGLATGSTTPVWFIERRLYDARGRVEYATDRFVEGTPATEITGTHTVYNADGRVESTSRLLGLAIDVAATLSGVPDANQVYAASLASAGTAVSTTSTSYVNGRVSETIDPFGRKTQYTYNEFGETIQVRRQSGNALGEVVWLVSRTVYDSQGRAAYGTDEYLEGTTSPVYGTRTLYDGQGRVVETRRLQGLVVTLADGATRVTKDGMVLYRTKTTYDAEGRVVESKAADGQITNFEYDALGRRTAVIGHAIPASSVGLMLAGDPLVRHRAETEYDAAGRVLREIANIRQFADGTLDRSAQQVTAYAYDAAGNVVATTRTAAGSTLEVVTLAVYDDAGRKIAAIDPLNQRTDYSYDSQGQLVAVILPAVDHPSETIGLVRPRYEYGYDAQGNQLTIRDNVYQVSDQVWYDHNGAAGDFSQDYDTRVTRFSYDSQGRQTSRTLPLGVASPEEGDFTETFEYDDRGRQVLHVSFEGVVTRSVYDDSAAGGGRLIEQRFYPSLTAHNDPAGHPIEVWAYTLDAFGRQVRVERRTLNASGGVIEMVPVDYTYDAQGRLTGQLTPGADLRYEYDSLGRKTRTNVYSTGDDHGDWRYRYDALGRLAEIRIVKQVNVPSDIDGSAANGLQPETTQYHYDLVGNLDWERHANGIVTDYEYDGLNRLTRVLHRVGYFTDLPLGGEPFAEYAYELRADGRRTRATESFLTEYSEGSLTTRQTSVIDWSYDALGRLVDEVFATDIDDLSSYAPLYPNLPESVRPLRDYADHYEFDLVGNRLKKTTDLDRNGLVDAAIEAFYDANDRLLTEAKDDLTAANEDRFTRYEYGPGASGSFGGSGTQQTKKTVREGLSDSGSLNSRTATTYDLQGRMGTVVVESFQADGVTVDHRNTMSFDYDHTGIRVLARDLVEGWQEGQFVQLDDATTHYMIDHENFTGYAQVLLEWIPNRRIVVYTLGHDVISQWSQQWDSWTRPTGNHILLYDGHGSTRVVATANTWNPVWGRPWVETYSYDAYGNALGFDPARSATTLLYSGEVTDAATGMQYLRARYYDPNTGRFNQLDPYAGNVQEPQSLHKYLYCHDDPINGIDPSGLENLPSATATMSNIGSLLAQVGGAVLRAAHWITRLSRPLDPLVFFVTSFVTVSEFSGHLRKRIELGQGGYEADAKMLALRNAVIDKWRKMPIDDRKAVIATLHHPIRGLWSWDIPEMLTKDKKRWTELLVGDVAEETLTYKGMVFPVAEVNYLLWGLVHRLAYEDGIRRDKTDLSSTVSQVLLYRAAVGWGLDIKQGFEYTFMNGDFPPQFETISGRVAWATYGWEWGGNEAPPIPIDEALPNAQPNQIPWPHAINYHFGDVTDGVP